MGCDMSDRGERKVTESEMRSVTYQTGSRTEPSERRAITDTLGNQDTRHSQPGQEVPAETRIQETSQKIDIAPFSPLKRTGEKRGKTYKDQE